MCDQVTAECLDGSQIAAWPSFSAPKSSLPLRTSMPCAGSGCRRATRFTVQPVPRGLRWPASCAEDLRRVPRAEVCEAPEPFSVREIRSKSLWTSGPRL